MEYKTELKGQELAGGGGELQCSLDSDFNGGIATSGLYKRSSNCCLQRPQLTPLGALMPRWPLQSSFLEDSGY